MPKIDLGQVKGDKGVSLRNRGGWSATPQYVNDSQYIDMVSHKGSLWTCLVTNTNVEPGDGKTQWELSASGMAGIENNLTTTAEGSALDARQGPVVKGKIDKIYNDKLITLDEIDLVTEEGFFVDALAVAELNSKLSLLNDLNYNPGSALKFRQASSSTNLTFGFWEQGLHVYPANIPGAPNGYPGLLLVFNVGESILKFAFTASCELYAIRQNKDDGAVTFGWNKC